MKRLSENENYEMQNEVVIFIGEIENEEMEGIGLKRWVVIHFLV
jgi:hypothetical protein